MNILNVHENAVDVVDVCFKYQKTNVLQNIYATVPKGRIYALLGPSGSGKTTLLRLMLGRIKPNSGTIKIFGNHPGYFNRIIGYMPQTDALSPEMTLGETMDYFASLYQLEKHRYESEKRQLRKVLCLPDQNQVVATLSGGQQKALSLALVFLHSPKLVILDEPTVGTDPMLGDQIWSYLRQKCANGLTVIIVTHYILEASLAHHVGMMRGGRLIEEGTPQELYNKYSENNLETIFIKICTDRAIAKEASQRVQSYQKNIANLLTYDAALHPDLVGKMKRNSAHIQLDQQLSLAPPASNCSLLWMLFILIRRNLQKFLNSKLTTIMVFSPIFCTLLMCITFKVDKINLTTAVYNEDLNSVYSNRMQTLVKNFSVHHINYKQYYSLEDAIKAVELGHAIAAIWFEPNFTSAITARALANFHLNHANTNNDDDTDTDETTTTEKEAEEKKKKEEEENHKMFTKLIEGTENYTTTTGTSNTLAPLQTESSTSKSILSITTIAPDDLVVTEDKHYDDGGGVVTNTESILSITVTNPETSTQPIDNVTIVRTRRDDKEEEKEEEEKEDEDETDENANDEEEGEEDGEDSEEEEEEEDTNKDGYFVQLRNDTMRASSMKLYVDNSNMFFAQPLLDLLSYGSWELMNTVMRDHNEVPFTSPVVVKEVVYAEGTNTPDFLLSGYMIAFLYLSQVTLTSQLLIQERNDGFFDRAIVAGAKHSLMFFSHFITNFFFSLVQIAVMFLIGFTWYAIPNFGSYWLCFILVMFQSASSIMTGLLISAVCRENFSAFFIALSITLSQLFTSGAVFPIISFDPLIKFILNITPISMPVESLRNVMLRGWDLSHFHVMHGFVTNIVTTLAFGAIALFYFIRCS